MKKRILDVLRVMFVLSIIWIAISTGIQRFKCDALTETQLFKRIPSSFIGNWKKCN